jgi:hypothetical protein
MYTQTNFKSKKDLKAAVAAWKTGYPAMAMPVRVFQPGPFAGNEPTDGPITLEGPHYPQPHRWYASAVLKNGTVISVK